MVVADGLRRALHLGAEGELAGLGVVGLAEKVAAEAQLDASGGGGLDCGEPGAEDGVELGQALRPGG